jgi:hypothetical protein
MLVLIFLNYFLFEFQFIACFIHRGVLWNIKC